MSADAPDSGSAYLVAAIALATVGAALSAAKAAVHALSEARLSALVREAGPAEAAYRRLAASRHRIVARWRASQVLMVALASLALTEAPGIRTLRPWVGWAAAVGATVFVHALGAELLASFARARPERFALASLALLRPVELLVGALVEPVAAIGRGLARLAIPKSKERPTYTETEVEWVIAQGERTGVIANEPARMLRNVLDFKDTTAREVMVPRSRVHGLAAALTVREAVASVSNLGHSRFPVFREHLDNIVGVLHAKDLFAAVERNEHDARVDTLARKPAYFVVENQPIVSILREMRLRRHHLAIVSDEYGGTSGIVTLEDVIEEIVGDIQDEYDEAEDTRVRSLGDGRIVADATIPLGDLFERLGRDFDFEGDFESLGGLVVHEAGRVPEVGDSVIFQDLELIVREADERRVVRVEIVPRQPVEENAREASSE